MYIIHLLSMMYLYFLVFVAFQSVNQVLGGNVCDGKTQCTDYITWGVSKDNEKLLNADIRNGEAEGVWKYNVDEKEDLVITYIEVNNVVLDDCKDCKACILSGGVGHSFVEIGLVIPSAYTKKSYYHRMIYGHYRTKKETIKPSSCTKYCESATTKSGCNFLK